MDIEEYIVAEDRRLVALTIEGDQSAFEHLFNRYRGAIHQLYVQRTRGNSEDVDDLLQEVFIKVYLNLYRYNAHYTFGQWIFTIARNTFIDFIRRKREEMSIDATGDELAKVASVSPVPDPEESIIRSQQMVSFERCLDRMSPLYRQLIEYRFFREYSYEEIARALNIPLGTVKTRIHRARNMLYKLLESTPE